MLLDNRARAKEDVSETVGDEQGFTDRTDKENRFDCNSSILISCAMADNMLGRFGIGCRSHALLGKSIGGHTIVN